MTGGVAVSVGGERDAALQNVADGWARLVSGRRGKRCSGERRERESELGRALCCAREAGRAGKVGHLGKKGGVGPRRWAA